MIINRIIIIVLMITTALLSSIHGGTITYSLFYLTWGLPVLSLLYLLYVFVRFKIYQKLDKVTFVKGEEVPYTFTLANEDIITYTGVNVTFFDRLSKVSEVPSEKSYSLTPGQSYSWNTHLCAKYKGEYTIGIEKAEITDFLHLFKMTYRFPKTILVKVLPRIPYYEHLVIEAEEYIESHSASRKDEVFPDVELRKFVSGDGIRAVNWKASARAGELFTRKYMDEATPEVFLLTDFSSSGLNGEAKIILEDKIVEASLGIAHYFEQKNITVKASYFHGGVKHMSIFSKQGMDAFYEVCAGAPFNATVNAEKLLTAIPGMLEAMSQIIIITHTISDELMLKSAEIAKKGHPVDIIYVGDEDLSGKLSVNDKFRVTQITSEQEVGDVLNRKA